MQFETDRMLELPHCGQEATSVYRYHSLRSYKHEADQFMDQVSVY